MSWHTLYRRPWREALSASSITEVRCDVHPSHPRVDLEYDGVRLLGAALQGSGGVMGGAHPRGYEDIRRRLALLVRDDDLVWVYLKLDNGEGRDTVVKLPAADVRILAVYPPNQSQAVG